MIEKTLDIKADAQGNITLEDPYLGKRTIKATDGLVAVIRDQLAYLRSLKSNVPRSNTRMNLLNDDIKVYEHILAMPDPSDATRAYFDCKRALMDKGSEPTKMQIARKLGWFR